MNILIFANTCYRVISGGDKIFIELGRRWLQFGEQVTAVTNQQGEAWCELHELPKKNVIVWKTSQYERYGVYVCSFLQTVISVFQSFFFPIRNFKIVFSSSEFWPSLLPAIITKLRSKNKIKVVVACYLVLPHPAERYYGGSILRKYIAYFAEEVSYYLVNRFADAVFTASSKDRERFYNRKQLSKKTVFAIRGGIDFKAFQKIDSQPVVYDAVFIGRFHPQKCVEELIDIWKHVLLRLPEKKLVLIGAGYLEEKIKKMIMKHSLNKQIMLLGPKYDAEKTRILKSSRLFLSASRFDSGSLALDESLACGTPGIIYELPKVDYPSGVVKVPLGNTQKFIEAVIHLLTHEIKRKKLALQGIRFTKTIDWTIKAKLAHQFLAQVNKGK
ncbi:glycosyltransferase family 4 protein [Candidatus Roizmanbacteria bacterium]|nr:glycosyltransferase family 4 protein [Candidatus Roizmanbacteria bacterium]